MLSFSTSVENCLFILFCYYISNLKIVINYYSKTFSSLEFWYLELFNLYYYKVTAKNPCSLQGIPKPILFMPNPQRKLKMCLCLMEKFHVFTCNVACLQGILCADSLHMTGHRMNHVWIFEPNHLYNNVQTIKWQKITHSQNLFTSAWSVHSTHT